MNTLDIVILAVVALFLLLGLKKGFIISLATLAGLVLGVYAAFYFSDFAARLLQRHFENHASWLPAASFTVTLVVVLVCVYFIGKLLEKVVDLAGMGILNHIAGALFGILKAVILISVAFYLISLSDPDHSLISVKTEKESLLYEPVSKVFNKMMELTDTELFKKAT